MCTKQLVGALIRAQGKEYDNIANNLMQTMCVSLLVGPVQPIKSQGQGNEVCAKSVTIIYVLGAIAEESRL